MGNGSKYVASRFFQDIVRFLQVLNRYFECCTVKLEIIYSKPLKWKMSFNISEVPLKYYAILYYFFSLTGTKIWLKRNFFSDEQNITAFCDLIVSRNVWFNFHYLCRNILFYWFFNFRSWWWICRNRRISYLNLLFCVKIGGYNLQFRINPLTYELIPLAIRLCTLCWHCLFFAIHIRS